MTAASTVPRPRVVGSGPHRVIAAHDWLVPTGTWGPFLECLDGSRFSCALLDARGYGRRAAVPGTFSMRELADDALALAGRLGWRECSFVGHSMSAKALHLAAAEAPSWLRVRKLVGITPTPPGPAGIGEREWAAFLAAVHSADARRALLDFSTGNRAGAGWLDRMTRASLDGSSPAAFAAYARSFAYDDLRCPVPGARGMPVKVFAGEHDLAIPESTVREAWTASHPGAEVEVLSGAGHYPMHETPVALAARVESFLAA
ncbi:alpha/beta hydrolase [Streptomyces albiaxialis]|uniref:Alpha/beta hydrolase n=1 Tax=Streptomyces albiaxialis TaxID=329523 RepID=A0ABN2VWV4_9ACTN